MINQPLEQNNCIHATSSVGEYCINAVSGIRPVNPTMGCAHGYRAYPDRPMDNGRIESLNGKLRDECLNVNLLLALDEARRILDDRRV